MRKAIFMYSLFAFGYFGFSTIPVTEVSAQTIAITSGNNQSTTRGQNFSSAVTFTVTNSGTPVANKNVIFGIDTTTPDTAKMSAIAPGTFTTTLTQATNASGVVTIHVKANTDPLYDKCIVGAGIFVGTQLTSASFDGKITDVLYFSSDGTFANKITSTTRSVFTGTAANTNIGAAVSATHYRNADTDMTNNVTLAYSFGGGTNDALFNISSTTGQLTAKAASTLSAVNSYSVKVKVEEKGSGTTARSSATIDVTITVKNPTPPSAPTGLSATPGDGKVRLSWTAPAGPITRYEYTQDDGANWTSTGSTSSPHTVMNLTNGTQYTFKVRGVNNGGNGTASTSVTATPNIAAPTGLTATAGDGEVRLSWTAPSPAVSTITKYQYTTDDGTNWADAGTSSPYTVTNLTNDTAYTFKVRAFGRGGGGTASAASESVTPQAGVELPPLVQTPPDKDTLPLVETNIATTQRLTVKRVDTRTVTLSWNIPTSLNTQTIIEYQYSTDGGQTWISTRSTNTSITITGDGFGNLSQDQFKIRAVSLSADGTQRVVTGIISAPSQRKIKYECPVGWTRESVFGKTKTALIYELKVNVDHTNRVSIYELASLAIYVHPEENLETLEGWYLTTGILYNHDHNNKFQLTAENSVIDEHGFAHIKNPGATPIRMGTLGFIGQSLPSFDYRLYDDSGLRVDFGISCYKEGGLTWRLWNTEDPHVLRVLPFSISEEALSVQMKALDWNTPFFRTQWTAAIMPDLPDAPAAPLQIKKNIVGTWADLKKQ